LFWLPYTVLFITKDIYYKEMNFCFFFRWLVILLSNCFLHLLFSMFVSTCYKCCSDYLILYCLLLKTSTTRKWIFVFQMTGDIAVKLFSTSASVTQDGLTACLGYLAGVFMTVNNHILIGQSTIPSSNQSQCSSIALSTVNFSNYFSDCTSGYVRASPGDVYYLCLRGNYHICSMCQKTYW
jgi:hypothetical protein